MPASKTLETLEATLLVMDSEEELTNCTTYEDNMAKYLTPTGSLSALELTEPNKSQELLMTINANDETMPISGRDNFADNNDAHMSTPESMPENTASLQNLLTENIHLRSRIEELELNKPSSAFEDELKELKRQLKEANSYVDQVDIEAEQQYTELTSEIDELCVLVETKENEITLLKEQIQEKKRENEKMQELYEQTKINTARQAEVIENLRDDLDTAKTRIRDLQKEKERQNAEMEKLKKQTEADKGDILAKEVMMSLELEEVQRELNRQKEILDTTNVASLIDRWERRVRDLENQISERDVIVHTQQAIINKLRSQSPSATGVSKINSGSSSYESFHSQTALNSKDKNQIFSFILSDYHNQLANIYAIGKILDLTPNEEQFLEKHLSKRANVYY